MRKLSNTTGPVDYGEEPRETGDASASPKNPAQELIRKANAVPLIQLLKMYRVRVDQFSKRTTCPFKSHSNGQERTPSFWYYPETNSFNCFGCHTGGRPTDFVMRMDNIEKVAAAAKILDLFEKDIDEDFLFDAQNVMERLEIMQEFSNAVLEFRQNYSDEHSFEFIEYVCWVYDRMNLIHEHDNDALRGLIFRLVDWIQAYQPGVRLAFEDKYLQITCKP